MGSRPTRLGIGGLFFGILAVAAVTVAITTGKWAWLIVAACAVAWVVLDVRDVEEPVQEPEEPWTDPEPGAWHTPITVSVGSDEDSALVGFEQALVTIGSDPACDVVIEGAGVAPVHFKLKPFRHRGRALALAPVEWRGVEKAGQFDFYWDCQLSLGGHRLRVWFGWRPEPERPLLGTLVGDYRLTGWEPHTSSWTGRRDGHSGSAQFWPGPADAEMVARARRWVAELPPDHRHLQVPQAVVDGPDGQAFAQDERTLFPVPHEQVAFLMEMTTAEVVLALALVHRNSAAGLLWRADSVLVTNSGLVLCAGFPAGDSVEILPTSSLEEADCRALHTLLVRHWEMANLDATKLPEPPAGGTALDWWHGLEGQLPTGDLTLCGRCGAAGAHTTAQKTLMLDGEDAHGNRSGGYVQRVREWCPACGYDEREETVRY